MSTRSRAPAAKTGADRLRTAAVALVLSLLLALAGTSQAELTLGVLPVEPNMALAELLASHPASGSAWSVRSFPDAPALQQALAEGQIDLALNEDAAAEVPGAALITDLFPSVLHILVKERDSPESFAALFDGKAIYAGVPGSLGHELVERIAADHGLDSDSFQLLEDPWTLDPDVFFVFGGTLARDAVERLEGFRLWSMGDANALGRGSTAEGLMLRYPNLRPFILPRDLYPSLGDEPVLTVAVSTLLLARADLDERLAFEAAATADHAAGMIANEYPLAGLPDSVQGQAMTGALPYHPGATRYSERDKPGFLERYAEVLALGFSLIIALGSASLAIDRRRRQARKDRLDVYYRQILELRPDPDAPPADAEARARELRAVQARVLNQVIDERIDADGALVAFLTLSNQALAEAEAGVRSGEPAQSGRRATA
ncbi:MAG: TAXI family TRAP transporter solute-binding subunit [Pseudomonadota bacterium]